MATFSGMRPSSGAAGSIGFAGLDSLETNCVSEVAAPEDGRTPPNRYPLPGAKGPGKRTSAAFPTGTHSANLRLFVEALAETGEATFAPVSLCSGHTHSS